MKISKEGDIVELVDYWSDKAYVLGEVSRNGYMLAWASEELRDDADIVTAAVSCDSPALEYASVRLKDNHDIVMLAIKRYGPSLRFASERLRDNIEVVFEAWGGAVAEFASKRLCSNKDFVLSVLPMGWSVLCNVPHALLDDPEIMLASVLKAREVSPIEQFASERIRGICEGLNYKEVLIELRLDAFLRKSAESKKMLDYAVETSAADKTKKV